MNKYTITRLMFPEPADNGGGAGDSTPAANDATATPPAPAPAPAGGDDVKPADNGNGYGFDDNGNGTPPADNGGNEEYSVAFDESDGYNEAEREFFTGMFKEHGIAGDVGGKIAHSVVGFLQQNIKAEFQAAEDANKKAWGKNFDANMKQTSAYLENTAKQLGFSAEDMRQFFNPQAYRFFNALRVQQSGEQRASGTNAQPKTLADSKAELANAIKEYVTYKNTPGFDPNKARAMADNINNMYGEKVIFF